MTARAWLVLFAVAAIFAVARPALAHPGVGIVADHAGNVYYTDLAQVWRIDAAGKRAIVVPKVHTHELFLDADGNLFGEHLWYDGEAKNTWGHRVWKCGADGRVTDVIPSRKGFREDHRDFAFVRDAAGAMYWAERGPVTAIVRRTPDGTITTVARGRFRNVRWMAAAPDGTLYVVDMYDLVRIRPDGARTLLAENLPGRSLRRSMSEDQHAVMGVWLDAAGNAYAAVAAERVVKRVDPQGHVTEAFRSSIGWAPSGGCFTPNGDLYVLEFNFFNTVRVTRVAKDGARTVIG